MIEGDKAIVNGYIDERLSKLRALEEAIEGLDTDLQKVIEEDTRRIREGEEKKTAAAQERQTVTLNTPFPTRHPAPIDKALNPGARQAASDPFAALTLELRHLQAEVHRLSGDMHRSIEHQNRLARRLVKLENRPANLEPGNEQVLKAADQITRMLAYLKNIATILSPDQEKEK